MGDLMIYIIIICLIVIGFLCYKLHQKQKLDKFQLKKFQDDLVYAKTKYQETVQATKLEHEKFEYEEYKLEECRKDLQAALDTYNDITNNKLKEIDATMEEQRQKRQEELDQSFNEKKTHYDTLLNNVLQECGQKTEEALELTTNKLKEYDDANAFYEKKINDLKQQFESIEQTLRSYDAEQQAKLFYTIQLPEEYYEDIEFLLTTVAAKIAHPDIISKLVWQEYVKPNLENTFKRIEIKAEPGIYKLTSLQNGKCYIGKSTDIKRRITDHFKSVVGITSIAEQAVHHAIRKEGFWNWTIEVITYCDKEQLNDLEKYYIDFFKAQEFGYNKTGGG